MGFLAKYLGGNEFSVMQFKPKHAVTCPSGSRDLIPFNIKLWARCGTMQTTFNLILQFTGFRGSFLFITVYLKTTSARTALLNISILLINFDSE